MNVHSTIRIAVLTDLTPYILVYMFIGNNDNLPDYTTSYPKRPSSEYCCENLNFDTVNLLQFLPEHTLL
jgi:hypothetical protein